MMPAVLTIAGSDPTSGAGLQADLQTFQDLGCAGRSAVTAITAQTEDRVLGVWPTPADILTQQLATAAERTELKAVKIGLVATAANVWAIVWFLRARHLANVVIDPLLHSSSGFSLLDPQAIPIFRQHLLPLATVITPNLAEATALAGMQVATVEGMEKAAQEIYTETFRFRGGGDRPLAVIIKGGHLRQTYGKLSSEHRARQRTGPASVEAYREGGTQQAWPAGSEKGKRESDLFPGVHRTPFAAPHGGARSGPAAARGKTEGFAESTTRALAIDVCYDGTTIHHIEGTRETGSIHGSGCRFASAVAAELAKGTDLPGAARIAKQYVTDLIRKKNSL